MTSKNNAAQVAAQAEPCPNERHMLALQCTWDISGIAEAVTLMADEAAAEGSVRTEALLRCYGTRIATLNGLVMAYLDNDGTTNKYMHGEIYGSAKSFEGGAV